MKERMMSIVFSSGIDKITEYNSSFDSGVLRVCYTGRNNNNSFISKDTIEQCIKSIYNCPIVCHYDRETDTIGSHDVELVTDDNSMRMVNITHPVGIVPESAEYWYEEIEDASGVHEYLCVNVLLWKRQEAYKKIKNDVITDESMEISVKDGEMIDGVYVIKRFEFTAFCLLGSEKPCYESASLEVFARDRFKSQLAEMMKEVKKFSQAQPSKEVDIDTKTYSKGGKNGLEQKKKLAVEYGFDIDKLGFSVDDLTLEELRDKFEAMKSENEPSASEIKANYALENQFRDELRKVVESEKIETCHGLDIHYWFYDYDRDASEVYATDSTDWNIYGFQYSMDGDRVVIDFESKKRMKLSISPFDEGTKTTPFSVMLSNVVDKYDASETELIEKYQSVSEKASSLEQEVNSLRQFKSDAENAIAKEARDAVFARFEDLAGIEAFEALRKDCMEYDVSDLEEKCFAIRGRIGTVAKFSLESKSPKLKVEKADIENNEPYGGLFIKYKTNGYADENRR